MPTNSPDWPSSWSPPSKNIANLVAIELPHANQLELNCTSNADVFLEYPWAYVPREILSRISGEANSALEPYKAQIEAYKPEMHLIGYASSELRSTHYVLCLTEDVRDEMVSRNRQITRSIHERVTRMMRKAPLRGPSIPDDRLDHDDTFFKSTRSLFEIEISRKSSAPKDPPNLSDRPSEATRDGYLDILLPPTSKFSNVRMKLVTKSLQTNLPRTATSVQTYLGYPKTRWTQYDDKSPSRESEKPEPEKPTEESSPTGHSEPITSTNEKTTLQPSVNETLEKQAESLNLFFEASLPGITDCIRYNSEINMHSDDIESLAKCDGSPEASRVIDYDLHESCSLVDFRATRGRVISDVAWHPSRPDYVAISYVKADRCDPNDLLGSLAGQISVVAVLWSIAEPLKPKLFLGDCKNIKVISFCPSRGSVLVGGTTGGQIVMWELCKTFEIIDEGLTEGCSRLESCASSDPGDSHLLPIRAIHWLPTSCRLEPNGKLSKIPDNMSMQFMTASEDGTVAFWDLLWQPNMVTTAKNLLNIVAAKMSLTEGLERLDNIFRPHYRLHIVPPKETASLTVLDLCPAAAEAYDSIQMDVIDPDLNESSRRLWVSSTQGELLLCSWKGQEFDEISHENVDFAGRSALIHDGPLVKIVRSHHVTDVLLTIGGSVFALWKDDFLRRPLLWRKRNCLYTSCCWCDKPGIFCVARKDGDLETWDICRKTREPVHVQTISGKLITGLHTGSFDSRLIGVCDYSGAFRIFKQVCEDKSSGSERIEWLRKFVDREVERNREFYSWQDDYLGNNEVAVTRREARAAEEARRRHEEAREKFLKDQEEMIRLKAERRALKIPKSKDTILRLENIERMKTVLLQKKGFDPCKLDQARSPVVQQQEEKLIRMIKAEEKVAHRDSYFTQALAVEFPDACDDAHEGENGKTCDDFMDVMSASKDEDDYARVRGEAIEILKENPTIPMFDWNVVMRESQRRKGSPKNQ
ncbi:WD repeat-containing protein 63 [Diachasma alloeum]|uniref:WD repeat-containing protein 63 n=1 Tax=Diachasma alloeum TaxID=454923 RepID=UPI0007383296|nr:WD repeat-containing protein 63 [Diachasma alloeum]